MRNAYLVRNVRKPAVSSLPILNASFTLNELRNEHVNDRVRPPISFKLATVTLNVVVDLPAD